MEVNVNNAFIIALKLSLEPCLIKYRIITESTLNHSHSVINYFLSKPSLTTLVGFAFALLLITAVLIAFITLIGVFISVTIIFLIEGFFLLVCLSLICLLLLIFIYLIILLFELKYFILQK